MGLGDWWDRNVLRLPQSEERSTLTFDDWSEWMGWQGLQYQMQPSTTLGQNQEPIASNFAGYVNGAYKANGVVFACVIARMLLFSEMRFQFRQLRNGRPGDLFGTPALSVLERPGKNRTTWDLLSEALVDADLAGNFFGYRSGENIQRLRPDWITIVLGSRSDPEPVVGSLDQELLGYIYQPGGPGSGKESVSLFPEQVAHFAPIPDPQAAYRGMSWLTPIVTEILGDKAAMEHKYKFYEQGATPSMVVSLDAAVRQEAFDRWVESFKLRNEGINNAYKTLYLGAGADAKVVGSDLKQVDFKVTQGHGETRICAAARVPPIIVGVSEGLEAATYSNYGQARRAFADQTMRPLWRNVAHSFESIIKVPGAAELYYDDRDIAFLAEDQKDGAEIQQTQATAIKALVEAGFKPDSVVDAVTSDDLGRLEHTDLFSVQLQPPGTIASNGNGNGQMQLPVDPAAALKQLAKPN